MVQEFFCRDENIDKHTGLNRLIILMGYLVTWTSRKKRLRLFLSPHLGIGLYLEKL